MHRSTDDGRVWLEANTGLTNVAVQSVAVSSGGILYAGTFGGGIFRSMDGGATWQPANAGNEKYPYAIVSAPNGDLYSGGNNTAWRWTEKSAAECRHEAHTHQVQHILPSLCNHC